MRRGPDWFMWALVAALAVLVVVGVIATHHDEKQWKAFSAEHDCKVIGKMSGTVGVGTAVKPGGGVATVTTYSAGTTGYLCNDGVTYWR